MLYAISHLPSSEDRSRRDGEQERKRGTQEQTKAPTLSLLKEVYKIMILNNALHKEN